MDSSKHPAPIRKTIFSLKIVKGYYCLSILALVLVVMARADEQQDPTNLRGGTERPLQRQTESLGRSPVPAFRATVRSTDSISRGTGRSPIPASRGTGRSSVPAARGAATGRSAVMPASRSNGRDAVPRSRFINPTSSRTSTSGRGGLTGSNNGRTAGNRSQPHQDTIVWTNKVSSTDIAGEPK